MRKILFLEDDMITHKLVRHALGKEYDIISCYSIAEANKVLDSVKDFSAVILDRGLPDGDGLTICLRLREDPQTQGVAILVLSSADAEAEKVSCFFAGADDYVTKPFGLMELKARVQARLRKISTKVFAGNLEVDLDAHRAHLRSGEFLNEIALTRTEFKILATLVQSLDQVFSRERLLSRVWDLEVNVSDRVVDSHVCHLRKKLSKSGVVLESLRGEGYRLTLVVAPSNQAA